MFTKDQLEQLRKLLDTGFKAERQNTEQIVKQTVQEIVQEAVENSEKRLKQYVKRIVKNSESVVVQHFDSRVGNHEKRIRIIEDELNLSRN